MNLSCVSGSTIARSFVEQANDDGDFFLRSQSKDLPIYRYRNEIVSLVRNNSVTIIKGATGCGKVRLMT
jgi:HrpA-like RNA helicase